MKNVCDWIRMEIVNRNFPPGMKLSEQLLCSRLNVSRTPIREALRHLESEGFISSSKHKGFVVTPISMHDIEQIYTILINLDSLAGRLSTPFITNNVEKLERLRVLCTEMQELYGRKDIDGYMVRNLEFHTIIFRSCENMWIIKILENLHCHTNRFIVRALYVPNRIEKSIKEHLEIFRCLETGDEKGVEKAISVHFSRSLSDLKNEISQSAHHRAHDN